MLRAITDIPLSSRLSMLTFAHSEPFFLFTYETLIAFDMQIFFLILEDGGFTKNSLKNKANQNVYSSEISNLILHFLRAVIIIFQPAEA